MNLNKKSPVTTEFASIPVARCFLEVMFMIENRKNNRIFGFLLVFDDYNPKEPVFYSTFSGRRSNLLLYENRSTSVDPIVSEIKPFKVGTRIHTFRLFIGSTSCTSLHKSRVIGFDANYPVFSSGDNFNGLKWWEIIIFIYRILKIGFNYRFSSDNFQFNIYRKTLLINRCLIKLCLVSVVFKNMLFQKRSVKSYTYKKPFRKWTIKHFSKTFY